jgi:hypothetical protein
MGLGGFFKGLLDIGSSFVPGGSLVKNGVKGVLGAAGAGLGAASQASANNRGEKFGGQLDLERLLMDRDQQNQNMAIGREQEGRSGASDAFRKLIATSHFMTPSTRPQLAGQYSLASRQPADAVTSGAGALQAEVLKRLQGGNPIAAPVPRTPNIDPSLLDAGGMEKTGGFLSAILGALGRQQEQDPRVMSFSASNMGGR